MMNSETQKPLRDRGEYRARVVSIDDPDKLLRVQVRVLGLWDDIDDADLPWAEIKFPVGARPGEGLFVPLQVDDLVWIDFINGDTRYPRVTGACHHAPGGVVDLPAGVEAGMALKMTLYGFTFEITPEGVLQVTQAETENLIQLNAEGLTINSDVPVAVTGKDTVTVTAQGAATVDAQDALTVNAAKACTIAGSDSVTITGSKTFTIDGSADLTVKSATSMTLEAGAGMTIKAGAALSFESTAPMEWSAPLYNFT